MKKKINSKKLIGDILKVLAVLIVVTIAYFFFSSSKIILTSSSQNIEINSVVDYSQFIESVEDGDIENVKIDISQVNIKKLGEYIVIYKYQDEEKEMKVNVVDTKKPQVTTQTKTIALNQNIEPSELIKEIKDETKTKVSFQKKYVFDEAGDKKVKIEVVDEGDNTTVVETTIHVVKDTKAPNVITEIIDMKVNSQDDIKTFVKVSDDYDKNPTVQIDESTLKKNQIGTYKVKVVAKDFSGNKTEKTIQVNVKNKINEKVVYLTFDDGPSKYTPEVLKILDKYNCKATFFVTGMNSKYRPYIKQAHNQGHTIGLHTYSHKYEKLYASTDAYFDDLNKVGNMVKEYIGYFPKYIRFPGGGSNTISRKYNKGIMSKLTKMVEEKGYRYYDWNAENGDGRSNTSKSEMIRLATSSKQNEIMILMHDANGKQNTVDTLPQIITYYQSRGYIFKAIDDTSIVPHQKVNN